VKRFLPPALLIAVLLATAPSASAGVSGTFVPSAGKVNISVTNNGPGSILRLRVKLVGTQHTGATADPPGAIDGSVSPTDFDYYPNQPIAPGETVSIVVDTTGEATGVNVQADEGTGLGEEVALQGPAPPDDPPAEDPCHCADLKLSTTNVRMELIEDHFQLAFGLNWKLDCAGASGTTCRGTFKVTPPAQPHRRQGLALKFKKPKKTITCTSLGNACRDRTGQEPVRMNVSNNRDGRNPIGRLKHSLGNNPDNGNDPQVFVFRIERTCDGKDLKDFVVRVAFNKKGNIDRKKSDLNGNGTADGKD
jgi:hypothetical protein